MVKLLWLAIRDIEDKRARERAQQKTVPKNQRTAAGHLVEGWKAALVLAHPDRIEPYIN